MKKTSLSIFLISILITLCCTPCSAGWIIFHKPPYKGKLIDAETKEPIEGAVVVAIYQKHPFISGPAGGSSSIVKVKEALTDKNGEFRISSYITLMGPNSFEDFTNFILYKPGYCYAVGIFRNMDGYAAKEYLLEKNYGKIGDIYFDLDRDKKVGHGPYGVVELKPAKTWEERDLACSSGIIYDVPKDEWPVFHKMLEQERLWLNQTRPSPRRR